MSKQYIFEWVKLENAWSFLEFKQEESKNKVGFCLSWKCHETSPFGIGCGEITFYVGNDEILRCENECMSKEFVEQALLFFARQSLYVD
jgi:hypothetical protein